MTNWKEIADRRLRLWPAGLVVGVIIGFILACIVLSPPYWIGMLPQGGF